MTTKEALHQLIEELPDDQAELARHWLEDLRHASDREGPPLDAEALASLDRGLNNITEGRTSPSPPTPPGRRHRGELAGI